MMGTFVQVSREGPIAVVRIENGKVNALSFAVLTELADAVLGLGDDLPGALIITGGDRVFTAGADINEFDGPESALQMAEAFHRAYNAIEAFPRVTIAEIAGYALGGGLELALACDLRVGSERAVVGLPEVLLGLIPGAGATQRLPRLIGVAAARRIMITGDQIRAGEAAASGILDEVVGVEALATRTRELAARFAAGPLVALALGKRAMREGMELPLPQALALEQELFVEVFRSEDARIGVESFKRNGPGKAEFTGR